MDKVQLPRFVVDNEGVMRLMSIVYQDGKVLEVEGVYMVQSQPGESKEDLIRGLGVLLHRAANESPVLILADIAPDADESSPSDVAAA